MNLPDDLKDKIDFLCTGFDEYAAKKGSASFDIVSTFLVRYAECTSEGMVHALTEIHRMLVPTGCLIDIHPFAEPYLIEVHKNGKAIFTETDPEYSPESYMEADKVLKDVVRSHLFSLRQWGQFEYLIYSDSTAELNSYFETQDAFAREPGEESLSPEEKKLFKRIDEIMEKAGPGAEVATRVKVHISKLISLK